MPWRRYFSSLWCPNTWRALWPWALPVPVLLYLFYCHGMEGLGQPPWYGLVFWFRAWIFARVIKTPAVAPLPTGPAPTVPEPAIPDPFREWLFAPRTIPETADLFLRLPPNITSSD